MAYKQQKIISHSLEAEKSKVKGPADLVSGETTSWFIDGCLHVATSSGGRSEGYSLFYKGIVLVCSCCYYKMPWTVWHLNNRN